MCNSQRVSQHKPAKDRLRSGGRALCAAGRRGGGASCGGGERTLNVSDFTRQSMPNEQPCCLGFGCTRADISVTVKLFDFQPIARQDFQFGGFRCVRVHTALWYV